MKITGSAMARPLRATRPGGSAAARPDDGSVERLPGLAAHLATREDADRERRVDPRDREHCAVAEIDGDRAALEAPCGVEQHRDLRSQHVDVGPIERTAPPDRQAVPID